MGLDLNVLGKPMSGHEAEFSAIILELRQGVRVDPPAGFLGRLMNSPAKQIAQRTVTLQERLVAISLPYFSEIGAPIVGRDAVADEWVRTNYREGLMPHVASEEAALEYMDGYHAVEALPECDGFPVYSNGGAYDGVDRASFRGELLRDCREVVGPELVERAWMTMLADELADYGQQLASKADSFAQDRGQTAVLGDRDFEWTSAGPASRLHVVDQLARWCCYWSERGHGSEAYF
jgi:hypothetical protein